MTIDTAALRELCENATKGAWYAWKSCNPGCDDVFTTSRGLYIAINVDKPDAAFIAAARTALPGALDEIDRLRKENATLKGVLGA